MRSGRMVGEPQGFLGYHGRVPVYGALVLAYGRHLRLAVRRLVRRDGRVRVEH